MGFPSHSSWAFWNRIHGEQESGAEKRVDWVALTRWSRSLHLFTLNLPLCCQRRIPTGSARYFSPLQHLLLSAYPTTFDITTRF
jgi:hypothetical protein